MSSESDYAPLKLGQLISLCAKRGIDAEDAESKSELITLLEEADAATAKLLADAKKASAAAEAPLSEESLQRTSEMDLEELDDSDFKESPTLSKPAVLSSAASTPAGGRGRGRRPMPQPTRSARGFRRGGPSRGRGGPSRRGRGGGGVVKRPMLPRSQKSTGQLDVSAANAIAEAGKTEARADDKKSEAPAAVKRPEPVSRPAAKQAEPATANGVEPKAEEEVKPVLPAKKAALAAKPKALPVLKKIEQPSAATSAAAAKKPEPVARKNSLQRTVSTTEIDSKVWHPDHRYIFSINNTIPVASATEKTFTAYLTQVLDVDTGEEATILRRYRQFEALHERVAASYPKKMVPKFTEKKRFGLANLRDDFIQKRCSKLQKYLNLISELPNIFEFPPMVHFLECELQQKGDKQPKASRAQSAAFSSDAKAPRRVLSGELRTRAKSPPVSPRGQRAAPAAAARPKLTAIKSTPVGGAKPAAVKSTHSSSSNSSSSGGGGGGGVLKALKNEHEAQKQKFHAERKRKAAEAAEAKRIANKPTAKPLTDFKQLSGDEKKRAKAAVAEAAGAGGTELHLSGFGLTLVPETVYQQFESTLQVIGIEFNAFNIFPDLSPFKHLVEVRLGGNQVSSLNLLKLMSSLRVLLINGNALTEVGDEIGALVNLERLDLSNNQITHIDSAVGKLTALEELNLSGNLLEKLPSEVGSLINLEIADFNGCFLGGLPNEFCMNTRLLELNLGNNNLATLPTDMGRLTRLCSLNLADNNLKSLPMSLGMCQGLDTLGSGFNIERNPIEDPKIVQKFKVGTDHLCQYLAMRLQAWSQSEKAKGKSGNPLSQPKASSQSGGKSGKSGGGGTVGGVRASIRRPDTEADKVTVLCNWAGRELLQRVKPKVREMREQLESAESMSAAAPLAKNIRALRGEIDKFCPLMSPIPKSPAPNMSGITDKLKLLKMIIAPICDDMARILDSAQMELDIVDTASRAVSFVKVTKSITALDFV